MVGPATKRIGVAGALVLLALGGWAGWQYFMEPRLLLSQAIRYFRGPVLPASFASGNGRIEATEYDIATKRAGRIASVLVAEGDMVEVGQTLARMDTRDLEADLREAQALAIQAREDRRRAVAAITQRESELRSATAAIAQRRSDLRRADAAIAQRRSDLRRADAAIAQRESELVLAQKELRPYAGAVRQRLDRQPEARRGPGQDADGRSDTGPAASCPTGRRRRRGRGRGPAADCGRGPSPTGSPATGGRRHGDGRTDRRRLPGGRHRGGGRADREDRDRDQGQHARVLRSGARPLSGRRARRGARGRRQGGHRAAAERRLHDDLPPDGAGRTGDRRIGRAHRPRRRSHSRHSGGGVVRRSPLAVHAEGGRDANRAREAHVPGQGPDRSGPARPAPGEGEDRAARRGLRAPRPDARRGPSTSASSCTR